MTDHDVLTSARWTGDRPPNLDYRPESEVTAVC
jgi:hypothetical protein